MDAEIGVIGLGTMGSMALWQLSRQGASVMGFEQFGIGHDRSAAGGETRIFRTIDKEDPDSVPLMQEAYKQWRQLEKDSNHDLLMKTNSLLIGNPSQSIIRNSMECIEKYDLDYEYLNADEAYKLYPQHSMKHDEVMIVDKKAGALRPEFAVLSAVKHAEELGAEIHSHSKVQNIEAGRDSVKVQVDSKKYKFRKVLITTGPWAAQFIGDDLKQYVTARRLLATWFAPESPNLFKPENFPPFSRNAGDHYFYGVPSFEGTMVKVSPGTTTNDTINPDNLNKNVDIKDLDEIISIVNNYLPGLYPDPVRVNTYMESYTPDGYPIMGFSPQNENLLIACGFSGQGFKYSPAIGKVVSEIMLEGKTQYKTDHYSPVRFLK